MAERRNEVRQIKEEDLPAWLAGEVDDLELATKKDLRDMRDAMFARMDGLEKSAKSNSRLLTGMLVSVILILVSALVGYVLKVHP